MGYEFYTDESIEYPFFLQMGQERGGRKKTDNFSRKVYFDGCRCPSCGKSKAVMKRSRRNDAFLLLCPVETCSLKVLTIHDLIKRCGTPALFEEWRKARWKKTYTEDWLPIKNRRKWSGVSAFSGFWRRTGTSEPPTSDRFQSTATHPTCWRGKAA